MKKVLFICSVYKPNLGGVETTIEQLSKHYADKGVDSLVLTKRYPYQLSETEEIGKTQIYRMFRPKTDQDYLHSINFLKKHLINIKPDIVHIIGIRRPMPLYGLLLARYFQVPFLVTFAGGDLPRPKEPDFLRIWQEDKDKVINPILQADYLTTFSEFTKKQAFKSIPDIKNPIQVIYAGIDLLKIKQIPGLDSEQAYFFTARRLEKVKGIDILIKAFDQVNKKNNNLKLIIAGDGPERESLKKLTFRLNLANNVVFLGKIKHEQVIAFMKGALAHICPSRAEGGGIVNFEAQAAGCLTIGSNAGGIPEYIKHNKTGIIFQSENINQLAKYLNWAAINNQKKKEIINTAAQEIRSFTWKTFSDKYFRLYHKLIKNIKANHEFRYWSKLTKSMNWELVKH